MLFLVLDKRFTSTYAFWSLLYNLLTYDPLLPSLSLSPIPFQTRYLPATLAFNRLLLLLFLPFDQNSLFSTLFDPSLYTVVATSLPPYQTIPQAMLLEVVVGFASPSSSSKELLILDLPREYYCLIPYSMPALYWYTGTRSVPVQRENTEVLSKIGCSLPYKK